jgi:phosphoglycerate dehydrogenase-like enzyme
MAQRLMKVGHDVTVWNRSKEKTKSLVEGGAKLAASPRELANASELVITILTDASAIEATYRGGRARKVEQASDFLELYKRFTGMELGGLTVGLVGLGAVGREVAARLLPFKARVLAYDPYVTAPPPGVTLVALDDLLAQSDVVSMHAPVTPETMGLLSRERLARMKPTAYFVNTARAALTDEDALYAMLGDGRLAGAALDVLATEPLQPDDRFLALDNVIVTPHIGGATVDVTRHQSDIIVDAIERHLRGERARFVANPAVYDGRG